MTRPTTADDGTPSARDVRASLRKHANRGKAEFFPRFFKSGPENREEGDFFLGVTVPEQRAVARTFRDLPLEELQKLLADRTHELRLTALIILVNRFAKETDENERGRLKDFYLVHLDTVNQWDLVDASAHKILGEWLVDRPAGERRDVLESLADSPDWWRQRVAVIACFPLIRRSEFTDILGLAERSVEHRHDLTRKAVGWMLREAGKRDIEVLRKFLREHAASMPRVMLRYAIEKMDADERKLWMQWPGPTSGG